MVLDGAVLGIVGLAHRRRHLSQIDSLMSRQVPVKQCETEMKH